MYRLVKGMEKRIKGKKAGKTGKTKAKVAKPDSKEEVNDVVTLNSSNWKSTMLDSDGIWLVQFSAPWCGHCKDMVPRWKKAAKILKGKVNLGVINENENKKINDEYGINTYPSIVVFGRGQKSKERSYRYSGARATT